MNEDELNAIVIRARLEDIKKIKNIIKQLDVEKPQVYVKARIIEISNDKAKNVGVKYGLSGGKVGSNILTTMTASLGGPVMAADPLLASQFKMNDNLKEGLALGAAISLLEGESAAEVLSEPSILCLNNKESEIYVGKTQSVKTATTVNNGGTANDSFKREDIGLTLKIKPRLSNDNKVTLDIKLTIENVLAVDAQGQPVTTKRTVETTAIVQDGEMVLLGGLVQSKDTKSVSKIPFLGDIPFLGRLFRDDTVGKEKTTLAVMLTPYILDSSRDLTRLRQELTELTILQNKFTQRTIDNLNNGNSFMTMDDNEPASREELSKQVVFSQ